MNHLKMVQRHKAFVLFLSIITIIVASYGCASLRTSGSRSLSSRGDRNTGKGASTAKPGDLTIDSFSMIAKQCSGDKSAGSRILTAAVGMIERKIIVVGSCWDYVNKVYDTAGFPSDKRTSVYGNKEEGPYIDPLRIKPGDWIMFRNLTFAGIGHSAIFVEWLDFESRSAITIEYAGLNRKIPGRYREYDITKCYGLVRGKE